MYGKPVDIPQPQNNPFQFTLRSLILAMVGLSALLALVVQWQWLGVGACLLLIGVAAMTYGVRRWNDWLGLGLVCFSAGGCLVLATAQMESHVPARRSSCANNLKQIVIALQNYHDIYGSFPPAYMADANGRPMHSWRVLILPFIEQQALYNQYRFDEPWDGPNNRLLAGSMPYVFRCPSDENADAPNFFTNYLAVVGPETAWPGAAFVSYTDIRDGTSQTLLIVESHDSGIPWMEPRDLHTLQMPLQINPRHGQGISSLHGAHGHCDGAQAAIADGSVRFLPNDTPAATIHALLTIDGGENVPLP